jgi:two-component system cell cycle sensor histidine kinase/response regulator CckA
LILVVDDDEGLRTAVARVLKNLGFAVLTANSGAEALALAEEFAEQIDLLLADVVMPELSGPGLVKRLAVRGIHPRVIYMSGLADLALVGRIPESPTTPLLRKPFSPHALARLVREALESRDHQA